jgi:hypothetical protein
MTGNLSDPDPESRQHCGGSVTDIGAISMPCDSTGSASFLARTTEGNDTPIHLISIVYVPGLDRRLFSVQQWRNTPGNGVSFGAHDQLLTASGARVPLHGDPLPLITLTRSIGTAHAASHPAASPSANLQHRRSAHANSRAVKIAHNHAGEPCPAPSPSGDLCHTCLTTKSSRSSFPKSSPPQSTESMELVLADIWGPFPTPAIDGSRYILLFIDYATRVKRAFPLSSTSAAATSWESYLAWANQGGRRVGRLRTDRAMEFLSKTFQATSSRHGVHQEFSGAYSHEQIGVVESSFRGLSAMCRASLADSGLDSRFWALAFLNAVHISNRLPTAHLKGVSPYFALFGSHPSLSHLRVFGCLAFAHVDKARRDKAGDRAITGIMVGHGPTNPAGRTNRSYQVFNPATGKIWHTPHVRFDETSTYRSVADPSSPLLASPSAAPENPVLLTPTTSVVPPLSTPPSPSMPAPTHTPEHQQHPDHEEEKIPDGDDNGDDDDDEGERPTLFEAYDLDTALSPHNDTGTEPASPSPHHHTPSASPTPAVIERPATPVHRYPRRSTLRPNYANDVVTTVYAPGVSAAHSTTATALPATVSSTSPPLPPLPLSYRDAMGGPESVQWAAAMTSEYTSLISNFTWTASACPPGTAILRSRWHFTRKLAADGSIDRWKARFVVCGNTAIKGVHHEETYSPVTRTSTVRMLVALATHYGWVIHQSDAVTAYLNSPMRDGVMVYIRAPQGFADKDASGRPLSLLLRKCLYGLKDSGRQWWLLVRTRFLELGFSPCSADPCVYVKSSPSGFVICATYIDDFLICGSDSAGVSSLTEALASSWKMKDLGRMSLCLGMLVTYTPTTSTIDQATFTRRLLTQQGLDNCNPATTPAPAGRNLTRLGLDPLNPSPPLQDPAEYKALVGSLLYLACRTRPDIAAAVREISAFVQLPREDHMHAARRILKYLRGSTDTGLTFHRGKPGTHPTLTGFVDASWADCSETRRSITGFVFFLSGAAISHKSQQQQCCALSSSEAEYVAASAAAQEAVHLRSLLAEVGLPPFPPTIIYEDNAGTIKMAANPIQQGRTKHIAIRYHFLRELVSRRAITLVHVPGTDQTADFLTKSLPRSKHHRFSAHAAGTITSPLTPLSATPCY